MKTSVGVVKDWQLVAVEGFAGSMNAASLVKQVIGHIALELVDGLDRPIHGDISTRHVLSHTTGLPNWRPEGRPLELVRPPGTRWGHSGEGFVVLQHHLEAISGKPIDELAAEKVFGPLGMEDSWLGQPEPGFHGYRPMMSTGEDYGRFMAHVLGLDDARWEPQWKIDRELAWGAGWGLELGPPVFAWQWGFNPHASNFVIGCPSSGHGVVVFTDASEGPEFYRNEGRLFYTDAVQRLLPGDHPSLRLETNATWAGLFR